MLPDAAPDVAPQTVTPGCGYKELWARGGSWEASDTGPEELFPEDGPMPAGKPQRRGADMSQHLRFLLGGKAAGVQATVRTGLGKSDRPGSQGGLGKRGPWWSLGTHPANRKGGLVTLYLTMRAPQFYPDGYGRQGRWSYGV